MDGGSPVGTCMDVLLSRDSSGVASPDISSAKYGLIPDPTGGWAGGASDPNLSPPCPKGWSTEAIYHLTPVVHTSPFSENGEICLYHYADQDLSNQRVILYTSFTNEGGYSKKDARPKTGCNPAVKFVCPACLQKEKWEYIGPVPEGKHGPGEVITVTHGAPRLA